MVGHPPGQINGHNRFGEHIALINRLPLEPTQPRILTTFTAGVTANPNPWGATWSLEDVETMASFLPEHAKRDLAARWEWSEANEPPLPMPNQPFLQVTWAGYPICYRGIHLNGETILIFHNEEDFLALSIADQFWITSFILTCDPPPPLRAKSRRTETPTEPEGEMETTPQPTTRGGEGAQEDVELGQEEAGRVSEAARRPGQSRTEGRIWPCHPSSPKREQKEGLGKVRG